MACSVLGAPTSGRPFLKGWRASGETLRLCIIRVFFGFCEIGGFEVLESWRGRERISGFGSRSLQLLGFGQGSKRPVALQR